MKLHFFLVDDDEDERFIFFEAIKETSLNSKCSYASTPESAFEMLKYLTFHFIFIDINMPKKNGFEFLQLIQTKFNIQNACIVMYSNGMDEETKALAMQAGADYCLQKQPSIPALKDAILNIVSMHSQSTELKVAGKI